MAGTSISVTTMSKWQSFAENTSIHGLLHVNKGIKRRRLYRFIWFVIVLTSLTCCIYQSVINVQDYLKYNVSISTSFENITVQPYPAITFWNQNGEKRTVLGRKSAMLLAASIFGGDAKNIQKVYNEINRTCYYEPKGHDLIDQMIEKIILAQANGQSQDAIQLTFQYGSITREDSFVKCWWNRMEVECEKLVLTTITDMNMAYSINLDSMLADAFINNESGVAFANIKFDKKFTQMSFSNKGESFQFLLNVNSDEYCAYNLDEWHGFGFNMKFHDPIALPSMFKDTPILLQPGYKYDVVIKSIQHIRETEHLGLCLSSFPLYMFPETKYVKELCSIQCETEISWEHCRCMITMIKSAAIAFGKHNGLNKTDTGRICVLSDPVCATGLIKNYTDNSNWEIDCSQCKVPCVETEYSYQVTATSFPPKQHSNYYASNFNVTDGEFITANYIALNVFFESASVNVIKEQQAFTFTDLCIYLGSNVGLFLGMSFMSFFEIFQLFAEVAIIKVRTKFRSQKGVRIRNIVVAPIITVQTKFRSQKGIQIKNKVAAPIDDQANV